MRLPSTATTLLLAGSASAAPELVFQRTDGSVGATIHFDEQASLLEVPGYCKEGACGALAASVAALESDVAALKSGMAAVQAEITVLKTATPPPAPAQPFLLAGQSTLNNYASIRRACPAGTEPLRCDSPGKYAEFLAFARDNGDEKGNDHFLANCILDNANSVGYYSGQTYVSGGYGVPANCVHCRGNGDGCSGAFGKDPLSVSSKGTSDWGLCDSCMHHQCESPQQGTAVCQAPGGYTPPPAPVVAALVVGRAARNTYADIRHGCPAGTQPFKCDSLDSFERLRAFSLAQPASDTHYLANCILDSSTVGYYKDDTWVNGGFGAPATCKNCNGNGNGCGGTFGLDALAFKAGLGTHDWGLCEEGNGNGCMHHECESPQTGSVVCIASQ